VSIDQSWWRHDTYSRALFFAGRVGARRRLSAWRDRPQTRLPVRPPHHRDEALSVTVQLLVNIDVDNLKKATEFYCKALGLTVGRRFGTDAIELLGASSPLYLLVKPNGTAASSTPVHLDFVVADIEAAVDRARNAGARLEGAVRTNNWGKIAMFADPFGHGLCLIEFVGRGYDEIASS
jgi:predicted enzyme related to lactoylglutathione lyase